MKKIALLLCIVLTMSVSASTGWSGRVVSSTGWSGSIVSPSFSEFVRSVVIKDYQSTCMTGYKVYKMPVIVEVEEIQTQEVVGYFSAFEKLMNFGPRNFEVKLSVFNPDLREYEDNFLDVSVSFDSMSREYLLEYLEGTEFSCD